MQSVLASEARKNQQHKEVQRMPAQDFHGLTVLTLESRRGAETARLIESYGGKPLHAAAMREVPLASNPEALKFAEALFAGKVDVVVFLTGTGARALATVLTEAHSVAKFQEALRNVCVVARGPKPLAVLREWNVPVTATGREPNTWRELLQAIDAMKLDLRETNVAVQEYGASNPELLEGLRVRGANVTRVPVYQWDLPEDASPLRGAIDSIVNGCVDIALFTSSIQIVHLFQVAEAMGKHGGVKKALEQVVKVSIGPTTSETLANYGLSADLQASRPKLGYLVKEAAEQSEALLQRIRASAV
jgi:uroporphyrinogen-III synthase